MKWDMRNNKNFWAGVMFLVIGAIALYVSRNYRLGTTLRMGPGYFPRVLSGALICFGVYIMIKGLLGNEKIQGNWSLRALIVLPAATVLYGILMNVAGFLPALVALVLASAAAGREFKVVEVLLLTVFLGLFSVAIFIWGIGLPYPLIKPF
jgi:hypothetical protein